MIQEQEPEFVHPEGKIVLLNGAVLDCALKPDAPEDVPADELKLDTTGKYLALKAAPTKAPLTEAEIKDKKTFDDAEAFFLKHAVAFYQHRAEIMADSRMFLSPVPIRNGIFYTGRSGFMNPTLGIWLEWLELMDQEAKEREKEHKERHTHSLDNAVVRDEDGSIRLVYHFHGSPMSGSNGCNTVDEQGNTQKGALFTFINYWPPFIKINNRYDEAKARYIADDLQTVAERLGIL